MLIHIMLEQTVYRGLYNDVSMLLDGKIIVLVEQQSTVNEKLIRALNAQKKRRNTIPKRRNRALKIKKIVYISSFTNLCPAFFCQCAFLSVFRRCFYCARHHLLKWKLIFRWIGSVF